MTRHELLTPQELDDLSQIDRLLDEANAHALSIDGHCKSSEGHIEVSLGNHWDRDPDEPRKPPGVGIYSYLLGPHRSHHFDSIAQALETVRVWHHNEMEDAEQDDPYVEIEAERNRAMEQMHAEFDRMHEETPWP